MSARFLTAPAPTPATDRLWLPDVTLVAVSSVALPATVRAMRMSLAQVRFGAALLLSDRDPLDDGDREISWRQIAPITSRIAYSRFMLRDLSQYVETSHALCVQWDGYVLDAGGWDPAFLDYDYIGAPWPHFADGHAVGNGGFSLRSRRLLATCTKLLLDEEAEDIAICRRYRPLLEEHWGIRFAPEAEARRFAYERHPPSGREFGFHGSFNMVDLLNPSAMAEIFSTLEPHVMNRLEHRELMAWALRKGHFAIAWQILRRMWRQKAIRE
jgi:hypothetical protein